MSINRGYIKPLFAISHCDEDGVEALDPDLNDG